MRKRKKNPLSVKQLKAIEMLIDIENSRTKQEIASLVGVSEATLYRWLNDAVFLEVLHKRSEEVLRAFKYRVNRALMRKIEDGNVDAIKLYYEKLGELAELGTLKVVVDLGGLDDPNTNQDKTNTP